MLAACTSPPPDAWVTSATPSPVTGSAATPFCDAMALAESTWPAPLALMIREMSASAPAADSPGDAPAAAGMSCTPLTAPATRDTDNAAVPPTVTSTAPVTASAPMAVVPGTVARGLLAASVLVAARWMRWPAAIAITPPSPSGTARVVSSTRRIGPTAWNAASIGLGPADCIRIPTHHAPFAPPSLVRVKLRTVLLTATSNPWSRWLNSSTSWYVPSAKESSCPFRISPAGFARKCVLPGRVPKMDVFANRCAASPCPTCFTRLVMVATWVRPSSPDVSWFQPDVFCKYKLMALVSCAKPYPVVGCVSVAAPLTRCSIASCTVDRSPSQAAEMSPPP